MIYVYMYKTRTWIILIDSVLFAYFVKEQIYNSKLFVSTLVIIFYKKTEQLLQETFKK